MPAPKAVIMMRDRPPERWSSIRDRLIDAGLGMKSTRQFRLLLGLALAAGLALGFFLGVSYRALLPRHEAKVQQ